MRKISIFLAMLLILFSLSACAGHSHNVVIKDDIGVIIYAPETAKAGEIVEIHAGMLCDAYYEVYLDGEPLDNVDFDYYGQYRIYEFAMPDRDVVVSVKMTDGYFAN